MSDKLLETIERVALEEEAYKSKAKELQRARIDRDYDRYVQGRLDEESFKKLNLGLNTEEEIKRIQFEMTQYIESSKLAMSFICESFRGVVPFFPRNLILVGAKSGKGKSTATANIAYANALQGKTTLIIANEEAKGDIYNRITCLVKGWTYANHDKFSAEQTIALNDGIAKVSRFVKVIDDKQSGNKGVTTTLEGIVAIFEHLIEQNIVYDCVILDYAQNVSSSTADPHIDKWRLLQRLVNEYLNQVRHRYLSPIVVMAQLHPDKDDTEDFETRVKGFKGMFEAFSCCLELRADFKNFQTEWIVHKNRWFSELSGQGFMTGWYKGRFVPVDSISYQNWKKNIIVERAKRALEVSDAAQLSRTTGIEESK